MEVMNFDTGEDALEGLIIFVSGLWTPQDILLLVNDSLCFFSSTSTYLNIESLNSGYS